MYLTRNFEGDKVNTSTCCQSDHDAESQRQQFILCESEFIRLVAEVTRCTRVKASVQEEILIIGWQHRNKRIVS
jgi:hypothetical protein